MVNPKTHEKKSVAAIVAAYNEGERIEAVLKVLTTYPDFSEVIVVDDGSTDATPQVAMQYPVKLIRQPTNLGKGKAMDVGAAATTADVIFFSDADILGLTHTMLHEIIDPVVRGDAEMMVGMRNRNIYYLRFIFSMIPILGGQRALTRSLWQRVPEEYKHRFMIEAALNFYARYWGSGYRYKAFNELTQTIKEQKYGFWEGMKARIKMTAEVVESQIRLQLNGVPHTLRSGRLALASVAMGVVGAAFGLALLAASYTGPVQFIRDVWAEELQQDPNPIFVHFLLNVAGNIGVDLLVAAGVTIIGFNLIMIALNLKNIRYIFDHQPAAAERLE